MGETDDLGMPAEIKQGKQNQIQERTCESESLATQKIKKKPCSCFLHYSPCGRWRLVPSVCWNYGQAPPLKWSLFLPATMQQRDNSPGLQQNSAYLLIMLSLIADLLHMNSPEVKAQVIWAAQSMAPQCWPSSLLPAPPSKSCTNKSLWTPWTGEDGAAGPGCAADCRHVCAHC